MRKPRSSPGTRLLLSEFAPLKWVGSAALAVLLISVAATLIGPLIVQQFVDNAIGDINRDTLVTISLIYLAVAVIGGISRVGASYLGVRFAWQVADNLRARLLRRFMVGLPVLEVERVPVGDVLEKVEGASDVVGRSISDAGLRLVGNVAVTVGALAVLFVQVPVASLSIAVLAVIASIVLGRLGRMAVARWEIARGQQADLFGFIGDSLAARTDLLALGRQGWATDRSRDDMDRLFAAERRAYIGGRAFWPVTQLFIALAFGAGFGFGLHQLGHGSITVGTLTVIYLYVDLMQKPMEEMSSQAGLLQETVAVLSIAASTLQSTDRAPAPTAVLPDGPLSVEFDSVTFGYGERTVLTDVSFRVEGGRSLGIVGRTGAGKSTVINLLCGLAQPDTGTVRIGGVDAAAVSAVDFARRVTVMSQRAHVFAATVRENITLFDTTVDEAVVWSILARLHADDWVRHLPAGLDTPIGAGGRTLSAGELQLIAGARALMKPYSLLIVDEGTSRLDPRTEQNWADLIDEVRRDRTVIMVEHRHQAIATLDAVMTMENGRVVDTVAAGELRR